jgi:hypothetical protein
VDEGLLAATVAAEVSLEPALADVAAVLEELGPLGRWEEDSVGLGEVGGFALTKAGDAADADGGDDVGAAPVVDAELSAAALGEFGPLGCWEWDSVGLDVEAGFALATADDAGDADGVDDVEAAPVFDEGAPPARAAVDALLVAALEELRPLGLWEGDSVGLGAEGGFALATAGDAADGRDDAGAGVLSDEGLLADERLPLEEAEAVDASCEARLTAGDEALVEPGPLGAWDGEEGFAVATAPAADAGDEGATGEPEAPLGAEAAAVADCGAPPLAGGATPFGEGGAPDAPGAEEPPACGEPEPAAASPEGAPAEGEDSEAGPARPPPFAEERPEREPGPPRAGAVMATGTPLGDGARAPMAPLPAAAPPAAAPGGVAARLDGLAEGVVPGAGPGGSGVGVRPAGTLISGSMMGAVDAGAPPPGPWIGLGATPAPWAPMVAGRDPTMAGAEPFTAGAAGPAVAFGATFAPISTTGADAGAVWEGPRPRKCHATASAKSASAASAIHRAQPRGLPAGPPPGAA